MSQSFAIPCPCGATVVVEVRQAGDRVQCSKCQQFVEVPRLRELKQFEPVQTTQQKTTADEPTWTGLPGALFALGLLALVISGAAAYYNYTYRAWYQDFAEPPKAEDITFNRDIQEITLVDSWETWNDFKKIQLVRRPQPQHLLAQARIDAHNGWLKFFAGLGTLGLLAMLSSFFLRPRRSS